MKKTVSQKYLHEEGQSYQTCGMTPQVLSSRIGNSNISSGQITRISQCAQPLAGSRESAADSSGPVKKARMGQKKGSNSTKNTAPKTREDAASLA